MPCYQETKGNEERLWPHTDKKRVMLRTVHKTGRAKGSLRTDQTIGLCPLVLDQKLFVLSPPTPWPPPSSGPSLCSPSQLTHWEDLSVFSFYVISFSLFFPLESDFHPFCLVKGILPASPLSCRIQCPFVCSYLRQTFRSMPHSVCFFLFLKHFVLLVPHGILLLSPYLISYCFSICFCLPFMMLEYLSGAPSGPSSPFYLYYFLR